MSLVQYIIIRSDLSKTLNWPLGAVIAQACHAATAVMHLNKDDPYVAQYTSDIDRMHKVILGAKSDESLRNLSAKLSEGKIDHKLWVEQPENFATCLALKPYPKEEVQIYFKKFQLLK